MFPDIEVSTNRYQQFKKIEEELQELREAIMNGHEKEIVSEAFDVMQSVHTLIKKHTMINFDFGLEEHKKKMKERGYKERLK